MATILPQYERLVGDDMDNDPAWPHIDEDDEEAKINTYPPGPSTGTGSSRVTFIFVPRWPLKGKQESVLGVMGKNKMETAEVVRRSFPPLAAYPPGRIDFYAPVDEKSRIGKEPWGEVKLYDGWSRIIPEAWPRLENDSPGKLVVMVSDGPGEAEERERRDRKYMIIFIIIISSPAWGLIGALCLAGLTGNLS